MFAWGQSFSEPQFTGPSKNRSLASYGSSKVAVGGLARPGDPGQETAGLRVMSPNPGEGASNGISSRLRVPPVVQYPRARRG